MAVMYIVENEQSNGAADAIGREVEVEEVKVKLLELPKTAKVLKVEVSAETIAKIQKAYAQLFPGNSTGTPAVIKESAYKFS